MQLGILTFLRRPTKTAPREMSPAPRGAAAPPETAVPPDATAAVAPPSPAQGAASQPAPAIQPPPVTERPHPFHSDRYGYALTLPAGWRRSAARSAPGAPPVDSFATADGAVSIGIWHEPCRVRALPPVRERAVSLPLAGGFVVPFEAYTPLSDSSTRYLEGRWLHDGRRWTINVQLRLTPEAEEATQVARVRDLVKSVTLDR